MEYARYDSPTSHALEDVIGGLEGGLATVFFFRHGSSERSLGPCPDGRCCRRTEVRRIPASRSDCANSKGLAAFNYAWLKSMTPLLSLRHALEQNYYGWNHQLTP